MIRECLISDAETIYYLNKNELGYDYPLDKTKGKLELLLNDFRNKIFVAVVDNKVVGYIHAVDYDVIYAPHMKNIMGIAVMSEYRQRGIGKALLVEVEKWAVKDEAAGVRLVSARTESARMGFTANADITATNNK